MESITLDKNINKFESLPSLLYLTKKKKIKLVHIALQCLERNCTFPHCSYHNSYSGHSSSHENKIRLLHFKPI